MKTDIKMMKGMFALLFCAFAAMASAQDYREGELIVKFKPTSNVQARMKAGRASSGVSTVDQVLTSIGTIEIHELFSAESAARAGRKVRAYNGREMTVPDVRRTYHVRFDSQQSSVEDAVRQLQCLDKVEFAEPNYIVSAFEDQQEEIPYDDPMLTEQTNLEDVNLPWLWQQPLIGFQSVKWGSTPFLAVFDTGVDVRHPDLPVYGFDSYDFVLIDDGIDYGEMLSHPELYGNSTDRNGHGTHCAGIAAASGNNGEGIVGANPDAYILGYTVLQANGKGDVAAIIKALGFPGLRADVISMSFGMYHPSKAFEEALINVSASSILVAAAGNDEWPIELKPCFPAAYSFVIGVQSPDAEFSNTDDDPINSTYAEGYNYEIRAPGMNILSTFPGGTYRRLSGTSMACPLVAGLISRLLQTKEYATHEQLLADLIHTSGLYVDARAAYLVTDADRKPHLKITKVAASDAGQGDGNGLFAPGEIIELTPSVINYWGTASGITLTAELQENEDPSIVQFIDNDVELGSSLSEYAEATSVNPIRLRISPHCADGRIICLKIRAHVEGAEDAVFDYELTGDPSVEIGGVLNEDMTLQTGVKYTVSRDLYVGEGVTLTVMPGAKIEFRYRASFSNHGTVDWHGEPGNPVIVTFDDAGINDWFQQGDFDTAGDEISYTRFGSSRVENWLSFHGKYYRCEFRDFTMGNYHGRLYFYGTYRSCNIVDNLSEGGEFDLWGRFDDTNIMGNQFNSQKDYMGTTGIYANPDVWSYNPSMEMNGSNLLNNGIDAKTVSVCMPLYGNDRMASFHTKTPCYFGSTNGRTVKDHILDADNYYLDQTWSTFSLDVSNRLSQPSAEAPGMVWKVVVNGYDAQDEYDMLPPLGLGRHKFEVYFNRPMDKDVTPLITMGVRTPYASKEICEDGEWNEDGTVYTAYITLDAKSNIDGINRIRVYGAEDLDHFMIPAEYHRFDVNVQVANSLATSLETEAGQKRITLRWHTVDAPDLMGYNLYWINPEEGNEVKQLNDYVIDGSINEYVVGNLSPDYTYTFYLKEVSTDLAEYDMSNLVTVTPLPLVMGDANESGTVDVADIVTEVDHIMGREPETFNFEAADVNRDNDIDVMDIVGTINIIMSNPAGGAVYEWSEDEATAWVENGKLWIDSPVPVAGIQVGTSYLYYSLSGEVLGIGRHEVTEMDDVLSEKIILCDAYARQIPVRVSQATGIRLVEDDGSGQLTNHNEGGAVYDLQGRRLNGTDMPKGIYIINAKKYIKQ